MFDEMLAKIFVAVDELSENELYNLQAITIRKLRQRAGKPVGDTPMIISQGVAEIASQLDMLSTANLALLNATISQTLIAIISPVGQG